MSQTSRYASAAEKQKAYRERKKQDETRLRLALALLEEAEKEAVTLLNTIKKQSDKHRFEIHVGRIGQYVSVVRDGYAFSSIQLMTMNHLIRTNRVTFVRKDWAMDFYHANG